MKTAALYLLLLIVPAIIVIEVLKAGEHLSGNLPNVQLSLRPAPASASGLVLLLAQVAVIVLASRLIGQAFAKLGQPQVMGEICAGIMLGPSLFGWVCPGLSGLLFPPASIGRLNDLSQFALVVFMFLVGLRLDPGNLSTNRRTAILTSHASIVFPFAMGVAMSLYLYPRLGNQTKFASFALFVGTAMSVTAFPVLARILADHNALKTRLGSIAICCAAVDDVTAWCILAALLLLVRRGSIHILLWATVGGSIVFAALLVWGARPRLARIQDAYARRGYISHNLLALILLLALGSALCTELLGIHALFGAFVFGAVMPKDRDFVEAVAGRMEDFIVVLLLPIFFANTGFRTSIGLLSGADKWGYCLLIVLVAIAGKLGGSTVTARLSGLSWKDASAIGILMNTRGLLELVVLNIGLDVGAISGTVFTMMVIMALVTTAMTTPLLALLHPDWAAENGIRPSGNVAVSG